MNIQNFTNYQNFVKELEHHSLKTNALQYEQNPVINRLSTLSAQEIKHIIQEYSQFSNEAIHMLLDARIRLYKWEILSKEIDHNIEEEKGLETHGVPHLEIMRLGYLQSIKFNVNNYEHSPVTENFLRKMKKVFRTTDNAYLAGALLAFESVSIPEFYVLDTLVNTYLSKTGLEMNGYLSNYINGHKLFEIGHKEGLMKTIEPYIGKDQCIEFAYGYLTVCNTISKWWNELADSVNIYERKP